MSIKNRKLKYDLFATFIFIQIITIAITIFYSIDSSKKEAIRYSGDLMDNFGVMGVKTIEGSFKEVANIVHFASYAVKNIDEVKIDNKQLTQYLLNGLKAIPYCKSIYIATGTGLFFYIGKKGKLRSETTGKYDFTYSSHIIRNNPDGSSVREEYFLNDKGKTIISDKSHYTSITYNPKNKDWYIKALRKMRGTWVDAYPFQVGQGDYHIGITYAEPLMLGDKKPQGVVAADILLSSIGSIIKQHNSTAKQIIFDEKGKILISNLNGANVKIGDGDLSFHKMQDFNNITHNAFKIHNETGIKRTLIKADGNQYIIDITPFSKNYFDNWYSLTYLPMDFFMQDVNNRHKQTLMICILLLILSLVIISFLAKRVAKPIAALGAQANAIRDFDLSPKPLVHSTISELSDMQIAINNMRTSLETFSRYVPKNLVKKLIDKGQTVRIGGKPKKLSILFCDIIGFTTATERMPAEQTVDQLCEFYEGLTAIMTDQDGCIDKFIGDAIMAFWNAPGSDKYHALHACIAALLCHKHLEDMNKQWQFDKKPPFHACFGIHTGDVILGNMGSSDRINYTIIGDNANLCSRIQNLGRFYGVRLLISQDTFLAIRDKAIVRPIDIVVVKGRDESMPIYELIAIKDSHPSILPTDHDIAYCSAYNAAYKLYLRQNWPAAETASHSFIEKFGKDSAAQIMLERITAFEKNPPPADWDGAFHAKSKR